VRLTSKQVYAPQAVLCVTDNRQPGRASVPLVRSVVVRQHSPDNIFVKIQAKCEVNLLGDPGAAEPRVAPFEFNNGINYFSLVF
jgi:hypothetical protein